MTVKHRIEAFSALGEWIRQALEKGELLPIMGKAQINNPWFTLESQKLALNGILEFLNTDSLSEWTSSYKIKDQGLWIGIVMAGNIPLVGFHDLLAVLISGNKAMIKLSSKDNTLTKAIIDQLAEIEPQFTDSIQYVENLKGMDAIIATGSDNSARYFREYFEQFPHIIRKNRVSCAILTGEESEEELNHLSDDIFQYFGMGCRNVSKLYVPEDFDMGSLDKPFNRYRELLEHNKYANNYFYNRSIYLMNSQKFRENGFMLMKESDELVSPVSVLFYEYYSDLEEVKTELNNSSEKIQCVVTKDGQLQNGVKFGEAQRPQLSDYADNVDTMEFLINL